MLTSVKRLVLTSTVNIPETPPFSMTIAAPTTPSGAVGDIEVSDVIGLPEQLFLKADKSQLTPLVTQLNEVTSLAEVNQLNLQHKAEVSDLNQLTEQVQTQEVTIANKASLADLAALAIVVASKADQSFVLQQIADLVGVDSQTLATIQTISEELATAEGLIEALEYTVANRVRFDSAGQGLTSLQKANARTNIGAEELGEAARLIALITAASIGAATSLQGQKADTALQSGDVAPVALSGSFTSLSNQASIYSVLFAAYALGSDTPVAVNDSLATIIGKLQGQISSLAAVARSGSYNDLTDKPTISDQKTVVHKTTTRWRDRSNNGNANPFNLSLRGIFETNYIIPANTLIAGDTYRFEALMFLNLGSTQAGSYEVAPIINDGFLQFSPTALGVATGTINASQTMFFVFDIIFPTVGSNGRINYNGHVVTKGGLIMFDGSFNAVNTTQPISLNFSGRFSASSIGVGNAMYVKSAILYKLNDPT